MAFVIDGHEWLFDNISVDEVIRSIENLLVRVRVARARHETVWIGDDLQTRQVLGEFDLWSLCAPGSPIRLPHEVVHELAAWLGSAPRYLDEESWPEGAEEIRIQINDAPHVENADVAWAHHSVRAGRAVACLSLKASTTCTTTSSKGVAAIHYINDELAHRFFWRNAFTVEGDNENTLFRLAPHAYPDLYFSDGIWRGFRGLAGGYVPMRHQIQHYLGILNDYGKWVFTAPAAAVPYAISMDWNSQERPSNQVIEQRFHALHLDVAPENPNVFLNKTCREAREINVKGATLYCEWHGKLEPHRNRLHIHPPVASSDWKVVIAIAHGHLPLP